MSGDTGNEYRHIMRTIEKIEQRSFSPEALEAWAMNVALECSASEDEKVEVAIGGAILDLRDLEHILEWASKQ